jgi:uncharacterized protein (DUF433 family)
MIMQGRSARLFLPPCHLNSYSGDRMARKKIERTQDDIREYPSYSIDEVAEYIGVPKSTLRSWISGYSYKTRLGVRRAPPIIEPADPKNNLLSFFNLIEAQVLAATRERRIDVSRVRRAIEYLRENFREERPLLNCVFETVGQQIFVQQLTGSRLKHPLNISKHGQYAFKTILKRYLSRIERDAKGLPTRLYPMKAGRATQSKTITIYPFVSSGKPSVRGSGIMAEVIWRRKKEGETEKELARDFKLKPSEIKAAITYFAA